MVEGAAFGDCAFENHAANTTVMKQPRARIKRVRVIAALIRIKITKQNHLTTKHTKSTKGKPKQKKKSVVVSPTFIGSVSAFVFLFRVFRVFRG
jgi:hypothetical protein